MPKVAWKCNIFYKMNPLLNREILQMAHATLYMTIFDFDLNNMLNFKIYQLQDIPGNMALFINLESWTAESHHLSFTHVVKKLLCNLGFVLV